MKTKETTEKELALLECDIEISKYQISLAMSLIMPFLLSFASVGIAASDKVTKYVFLGLSIFLFFILAGIVFIDSKSLIKKYTHKKSLVIKRLGE